MPSRALLSVSDKTAIVDVARRLKKLDYDIISTGGTAGALTAENIPVTRVEDITGFPECFSGRVKTMHPKLMGGILYRRDDSEHAAQAKKLGIEPIDIVIVNLYPFGATLTSLKEHGMSGEEFLAQAIEQIDIGGPTLLRSAAKNFHDVIVVCDPADYDRVLTAMESGKVTPELKRELAAKVFLHTAAYDALIASFLSEDTHGGVLLTGGRKLRYGENPHQWGKFYDIYNVAGSHASSPKSQVRQWKLLQGKELSYLNILDADAAWRMAAEFSDPTAVFVKHANPSGIASHKNIDEAFQRAYDADRLSAFGVIIALNRPCTQAVARKILDQKIFTELLLAPGFEKGAAEILQAKPNIRVLDMDGFSLAEDLIYRSAFGGMLVQNDDLKKITGDNLTSVTSKKPKPTQLADLLFAWKVVKHTKSNAIVFVKDLVTIGIGSGQTNRVEATWIAAKRAGEKSRGAVMASDAFFPFPDSLEEAAKHGIAAIIQPGGSIRDKEVFAKAEELGIAVVTTGVRAFRH